MKVHCGRCLCDENPKKANKNIFSLEAKCGKCGADIDVSQSTTMQNLGRFLRIPCYIVMAYVVLYISQHMPDSFESLLYTLGYVAVIAAVVYGLYCIIANILIFIIKN